jgi:hypothetical protein
MRAIALESARASGRRPPAFFALVVAVSFAFSTACKPQVQKVSTDIGGGMLKGSPPLCYQYRSEVRPTNRAKTIWVHVNNTCAYLVDCQIYDDVTEGQHHVVEPAYGRGSFLLAAQVDVQSVDLQIECTWKP